MDTSQAGIIKISLNNRGQSFSSPASTSLLQTQTADRFGGVFSLKLELFLKKNFNNVVLVRPWRGVRRKRPHLLPV